MLIAAVEPQFIVDMEEPYVGYNNVTLCQMLKHLFESYGMIHATKQTNIL